MSSKAVIPIPPAQRWKEFRVNVMPGLAFGLALLAALVIWNRYAFLAPLVGKAEAIQATVASPKAGVLCQLRVTRFGLVRQGDPIVDVMITEPRVLISSLNVIRAEIELLRATMAPAADAQRNTINYEQARIDWMRQRVDLATAQANLILATNEFQRTESLYKDHIVSQSVYETCRTTMDALQTQIAERAKLVEASRKNLERVQQITEQTVEPEAQLRAAIAVQDEKLKQVEAEMSPITLKAPMSGLVNLIQKYGGETVVPGEAIVSISATNAQRIVGYLRQPIYLEPKIGMDVMVRTRRLNGQVGWGKILAVGAQLQPISDALLPPTRMNVAEQGLPILVSLPDQFRIHPGEFVDLSIRERK